MTRVVPLPMGDRDFYRAKGLDKESPLRICGWSDGIRHGIVPSDNYLKALLVILVI